MWLRQFQEMLELLREPQFRGRGESINGIVDFVLSYSRFLDDHSIHMRRNMATEVFRLDLESVGKFPVESALALKGDSRLNAICELGYHYVEVSGRNHI